MIITKTNIVYIVMNEPAVVTMDYEAETSCRDGGGSYNVPDGLKSRRRIGTPEEPPGVHTARSWTRRKMLRHAQLRAVARRRWSLPDRDVLCNPCRPRAHCGRNGRCSDERSL